MGVVTTPSTTPITRAHTLKDCASDIHSEEFGRSGATVKASAEATSACKVDVRNAKNGLPVTTSKLVSQSGRLYWTTDGGIDREAKGCSCAL